MRKLRKAFNKRIKHLKITQINSFINILLGKGWSYHTNLEFAPSINTSTSKTNKKSIKINFENEFWMNPSKNNVHYAR